MISVEGKKSYRTLLTLYSKEVVREYLPMKRTISYKGKYKSIQLPYVIFAFYNEQLYIAFSKHPIKSLFDTVYFSSLGNTYFENWKICGVSGNDIEDAIQRFWQTQFNSDLTFGSKIRQLTFGGFYGWEQISKKEDSENLVLNLISEIYGYDASRKFIEFLKIYGSEWGNWDTHLHQNLVISSTDSECQCCKHRYFCHIHLIYLILSPFMWFWKKLKKIKLYLKVRHNNGS
jgi:hypothetical protein